MVSKSINYKTFIQDEGFFNHVHEKIKINNYYYNNAYLTEIFNLWSFIFMSNIRPSLK